MCKVWLGYSNIYSNFWGVLLNANKEAELLQIVEKILNLDSAMRFAAILI